MTSDTLKVSGMIFLEYANQIEDNNMMVALNATVLLISLQINPKKHHAPILENTRLINLPYQWAYPNTTENR